MNITNNKSEVNLKWQPVRILLLGLFCLAALYIGETLYMRTVDTSLAAQQLTYRSDVYMELSKVRTEIFDWSRVGVIVITPLWMLWSFLKGETAQPKTNE